MAGRLRSVEGVIEFLGETYGLLSSGDNGGKRSIMSANIVIKALKNSSYFCNLIFKKKIKAAILYN